MHLNESLWDKTDLSNVNFSVWHETGMPIYLNYNTD